MHHMHTPCCLSDACAQGRQRCPTPEACLTHDDERLEGAGAVVVPLVSAAVYVVLGVVLWLALTV